MYAEGMIIDRRRRRRRLATDIAELRRAHGPDAGLRGGHGIRRPVLLRLRQEDIKNLAVLGSTEEERARELEHAAG